MDVLPLILGTLSGICIGTGLIYLFTGLRRPGGDWLHLTFAVFALAYAGANITSILEYKTNSLAAFMRLGDWTALFTGLTLIFLLWFVAVYTQVRPRVFLVALTAVISLVVLVAIFRANAIYTQINGIYPVTLPWGESIVRLDAAESLWGITFFLANILLVGFLIYACVRQFRSGRRREALTLGFGLLFLMFALIFDLLFIDSGEVNFVYLGDYGFIPLLIVMSLQLANSVIKTEEELAHYRGELESLVEERTAALQRVNAQLQEEAAEREQAQRQLRHSERTARALLDAPPDLALLIDPQGVILDINQVAAGRLDIEPGSAIGTSVYTLFEAEIAAQREAKTAQLVETGLPVRWEDERQGRFFDNNLYPILDDSGNVTSIAVFSMDITERKQVEESLKTAAAAEERTRLARDLHDAVTQTIYSASLIAEVLPSVWARDPQAGERNLAKLRQLVRGALGEMRTLLFELRPSSLQAADLRTLLGHLSEALTGRTRILVEQSYIGASDPPPEVKIALYRIAQEAFNNIAKHSEAARVEVELRSEPGAVLLTIQDNGLGFDPAKVSEDKLGLRIMQERAQEVGAQLGLHSERSQGTFVSVEWSGQPSDRTTPQDGATSRVVR